MDKLTLSVLIPLYREEEYISHRRIKQRIEPILGFKRFEYATVPTGELAHKIRKHEFKTGKLAGRSATVSRIWAAVLAAWIWKFLPERWSAQFTEVCTRSLC